MPSGWWSFDGRHGYSVEYVPGRPQEMRGILLTSSPPQMLDLMYSPPNWLGLHVRTDPAVALTDMLTGGQARVTEIEEYEGSPAYRVDLGVHEKAAEGPWSWSAVVCPSRDGLPVEISSAPADTNPDHDRLSDTLGRVRFLVTEFQEVEDSALRRKRWMPRKMTLEVGNTRWELEASSVSVNHVIPAGAFVPKPQPGTEMIDDTVPGKRRVRTYKPEAALARRAEMLADQARNGPVPPSSSPVASPPDPMFWSRIAMWGGALSLLGAAVFFIVRSRNARSS